jgi:hypothetical protein
MVPATLLADVYHYAVEVPIRVSMASVLTVVAAIFIAAVWLWPRLISRSRAELDAEVEMIGRISALRPVLARLYTALWDHGTAATQDVWVYLASEVERRSCYRLQLSVNWRVENRDRKYVTRGPKELIVRDVVIDDDVDVLSRLIDGLKARGEYWPAFRRVGWRDKRLFNLLGNGPRWRWAATRMSGNALMEMCNDSVGAAAEYLKSGVSGSEEEVLKSALVVMQEAVDECVRCLVERARTLAEAVAEVDVAYQSCARVTALSFLDRLVRAH